MASRGRSCQGGIPALHPHKHCPAGPQLTHSLSGPGGAGNSPRAADPEEARPLGPLPCASHVPRRSALCESWTRSLAPAMDSVQRGKLRRPTRPAGLLPLCGLSLSMEALRGGRWSLKGPPPVPILPEPLVGTWGGPREEGPWVPGLGHWATPAPKPGPLPMGCFLWGSPARQADPGVGHTLVAQTGQGAWGAQASAPRQRRECRLSCCLPACLGSRGEWAHVTAASFPDLRSGPRGRPSNLPQGTIAHVRYPKHKSHSPLEPDVTLGLSPRDPLCSAPGCQLVVQL